MYLEGLFALSSPGNHPSSRKDNAMTQSATAGGDAAAQVPTKATPVATGPNGSLVRITVASLVVAAAVTAGIVALRDDTPTATAAGAETGWNFAEYIANSQPDSVDTYGELRANQKLAAGVAASGAARLEAARQYAAEQAHEAQLVNGIDPTVDNSFDVAEQIHMEQLAAVAASASDNSFDVAEQNRMEGLAPTTDGYPNPNVR